MLNYTFESGISGHIAGLIEQKRSNGFAYDSGEKLLKRFDGFCTEKYPSAVTVTEELAQEWCRLRPGQGAAYHNNKITILRQLGFYIQSLGLQAYIPHSFCKTYKPIPYIPSGEEIRALLYTMEISPPYSNKEIQRLEEECRIMFLLYFCCGLRLSEARFLRKEHVDTKTGVLTILKSKGDKDRLVYLPEDGIEIIAAHKQRMEKEYPTSPWMFPGYDPEKPISCSRVEGCFNRCWNRLPFSSRIDKKPTPHCLRHAFVVERLNDWMLQGIDINRMLPYLSKYLGHKSPSETFYYYHLVNKAFDVIRLKDTTVKHVIPEVIPYEND